MVKSRVLNGTPMKNQHVQWKSTKVLRENPTPSINLPKLFDGTFPFFHGRSAYETNIMELTNRDFHIPTGTAYFLLSGCLGATRPTGFLNMEQK